MKTGDRVRIVDPLGQWDGKTGTLGIVRQSRMGSYDIAAVVIDDDEPIREWWFPTSVLQVIS